MEASPNQYLLPMKGTVERETRAKALAAKATRAVIEGLNAQPRQRIPGEIGSVLFPQEIDSQIEIL